MTLSMSVIFFRMVLMTRQEMNLKLILRKLKLLVSFHLCQKIVLVARTVEKNLKGVPLFYHKNF